MIKSKYLPIIDEICYFIYNRAFKYEKKKILSNCNIEEGVRIGRMCKFDKNVSIGKYTYCGDNVHIFAGEYSKVKIGKYCAIGNNVHIKARTHDLERPTANENFPHNKRVEDNITIGDYVWIGDNVFIREGITIGTNAVIAANSVVTHDVKEKEIVAGVPARHIKINNKLKIGRE